MPRDRARPLTVRVSVAVEGGAQGEAPACGDEVGTVAGAPPGQGGEACFWVKGSVSFILGDAPSSRGPGGSRRAWGTLQARKRFRLSSGM